MKNDLWARWLEHFKKHEKPEVVLMFPGSAELTRIVVAWTGVSVARKKRPSACRDVEEDATWNWLWENVEYSKDEFPRRIPGATRATEQRFAALIANRVLYPDGTMNSFVEKYLKERVLTLFRVRRPARCKVPPT